MKTIKMIDLLNKNTNGEEVLKIKYCNKIYTLSGLVNDYKNEDGDYLTDKFDDFDILNDEVEILEEEKQETKPITKKDFETLGYACGEIQKAFTNGWTKSLENKKFKNEKKIPEKLDYKYINSYGNISQHKKSEEPIINKINEILDYLDNKGE